MMKKRLFTNSKHLKMDIKKFLNSDETIFRDSVALDYDYIPKIIPYREAEQKEIIFAIKPLLQKRNGKNIFIYGKPGIGKTLICKSVLNELEETTDEIFTFYINCWKKNSTYKVAMQLAEELNIPFVQTKKTDEVLELIKKEINKKSAVFVFDEADKIEDYSFLYFTLEEIYRKSVIIISNNREWIINLDSRIRSRLLPQVIEFKPYNKSEVEGILKERIKYAFHDGVLTDEAFKVIVEKTFESEDIRVGLFLLREAGNNAELRSSNKIEKEDAVKAIKQLNTFSIKSKSDLDEETKKILKICRENSGKKIGELYKIYTASGGTTVYKTFQRKIAKLEKAGFLKLKKLVGGPEGTTTIINYAYKDLNSFVE